jgi:hypothetical protein
MTEPSNVSLVREYAAALATGDQEALWVITPVHPSQRIIGNGDSPAWRAPYVERMEA